MRIAKASEGGDFYVSFCDLVLALLIIFLVITLALTLRVNQTVKRLKQESTSVISPSRFTGSTGTTKFDFCLLPGEVAGTSETAVVVFPATVAAKWGQARTPSISDPVLDLCRHYREKTLLVIPKSDFVKMAGGLTTEPTLPDLLTCPALHNQALGDVVQRLMLLNRRDSSASSMSLEQLRDAIGGVYLHASVNEGGPPRPARTPFDTDTEKYGRWLNGIERGENEVIGPFNEASRVMKLPPPQGIRLSVVDEHTVRIGRASLTIDQFRALLSALLPGRHFVIEHVDLADGHPMPAPVWFERDVLAPLGYDGRVLKINAKK